jgi:hypothetical protein
VGVFVGVAVFGGKVGANVDVIVGRGVLKTARVSESGGGMGVLVAGISISIVGSSVGVAVPVGAMVGTTATEINVGLGEASPVPSRSERKLSGVITMNINSATTPQAPTIRMTATIFSKALPNPRELESLSFSFSKS